MCSLSTDLANHRRHASVLQESPDISCFVLWNDAEGAIAEHHHTRNNPSLIQ